MIIAAEVSVPSCRWLVPHHPAAAGTPDLRAAARHSLSRPLQTASGTSFIKLCLLRTCRLKTVFFLAVVVRLFPFLLAIAVNVTWMK